MLFYQAKSACARVNIVGRMRLADLMSFHFCEHIYVGLSFSASQYADTLCLCVRLEKCRGLSTLQPFIILHRVLFKNVAAVFNIIAVFQILRDPSIVCPEYICPNQSKCFILPNSCQVICLNIFDNERRFHNVN